jgi:hypothetical protein
MTNLNKEQRIKLEDLDRRMAAAVREYEKACEKLESACEAELARLTRQMTDEAKEVHDEHRKRTEELKHKQTQELQRARLNQTAAMDALYLQKKNELDELENKFRPLRNDCTVQKNATIESITQAHKDALYALSTAKQAVMEGKESKE